MKECRNVLHLSNREINDIEVEVPATDTACLPACLVAGWQHHVPRVVHGGRKSEIIELWGANSNSAQRIR